MGDFNAQTSSNQAILLSNYSNPNPLWLDKDLTLASTCNRSFEDLGENLFGFELVKLCSNQGLIICNSLEKWPNSSHMSCIHGLDSSVVDYVISNIHFYNKIIISVDILSDHDPNSDHRPLSVPLNLVLHRHPIEDIPCIQKKLIFDKNKKDLFLYDLKINLLPLSCTENIEDLYHNFSTTLSYSINKLGVCKKMRDLFGALDVIEA